MATAPSQSIASAISSFAGALPDGTKVSQSAMRSEDGYWPLYASLYGGSGCLLSWLEFPAPAQTLAMAS